MNPLLISTTIALAFLSHVVLADPAPAGSGPKTNAPPKVENSKPKKPPVPVVPGAEKKGQEARKKEAPAEKQKGRAKEPTKP